MTHEEKVAYRCAILQGLASSVIDNQHRIEPESVPNVASALASFTLIVIDAMERMQAAKDAEK